MTPRSHCASDLEYVECLRNDFAMAVMPVAFEFFDRGYCGANHTGNAFSVAECAYQLADKMLERTLDTEKINAANRPQEAPSSADSAEPPADGGLAKADRMDAAVAKFRADIESMWRGEE